MDGPIKLNLEQRLRELAEEDTTISDAVRHFERGNKAYSQDKFGVAISEYEKAIEIDPEISASVYCNLGNVFVKLDQYDRAVEIYKKGLKVEPESASLHFNLGCVLHLKGDPKAIKEYSKTIELDPQHLNAHIHLAEFLVNAKEYYAAFVVYSKTFGIIGQKDIESLKGLLKLLEEHENEILEGINRSKQNIG